MKSEIFDCIVIGAGAAGLACARQLLDYKLNVVILEGRNRIGGRAHTVREETLGFPIELGAEFIHGAPEEVFKRLKAAGLTFYDLQDEHFERKKGKLQKVSTFESLSQLWKKLDPARKPDRSVHEFLDAQRKIPGDVRKLAKAYVEGFHGADLNLIGERGLAIAEQGGEDLNGEDAFRITEGYDKFMASFVQGLQQEKNPVRLNTIVKAIIWKKDFVQLKLKSSAGFELPDLFAKKVVVTVPLGVLKASEGAPAAIKFEPLPQGFEKAIGSLEMGHALRITFRFRSSELWENLTKDPLVYLHAGPEFNFPTWWTMLPMRTPLIVGWQGGPGAEKLSYLSEEERVQTALATLSHLLGLPIETLQQELVSWHMYDWSQDPFSYGAYSYVGLDGDTKSRKLSAPFLDTLYFAGEATHAKAERGTIDGAIDTGLRAARQILGNRES